MAVATGAAEKRLNQFQKKLGVSTTKKISNRGSLNLMTVLRKKLIAEVPSEPRLRQSFNAGPVYEFAEGRSQESWMR